MARTLKVTSDIVVRAYELRRSNPKLKTEDIATLCGVGTSTAGKILHGDYDELLEEQEPQHQTSDTSQAVIATQLKELTRAIARLTQVLSDQSRPTDEDEGV